MSDWNYLNRYRMRRGQFGTDDSDGFNGFFSLTLNGMRVKVIASDGEGWRHVSVSLNDSGQPPSWSIMCQVKDLFWNDEDWVVQFHPAKSAYVNQHPGCLHLWQPTHKEMPIPDPLMVGVRDIKDLERINGPLRQETVKAL